MTTIPGWNYDKPTEKALIAEFAKTMGADAAHTVWVMLCHRLGLTQPVGGLDDLIAVSDAMIELGDTTRVAGRGARIRLITYRALHAPVTAPRTTPAPGTASPSAVPSQAREDQR